MVKLMKLIKTIAGIVLLNKAVRSGLIVLMMSSINKIIRREESPMRNRGQSQSLQALLEIVLASLLSMWTKADGTVQQRGALDIGGLMADLMKVMTKSSEEEGRIIESSDYKIIEEKR